MELRVQIGELAERTGVSRRSIRYYEQQGLLHPGRTDKGWRTYDEAAVLQVRNIAELIGAGLTVEDIGHLAPCLAMEDLLACDDPGVALEMYQVRLRILDARMATLQRHRDELAQRVQILRSGAAQGRA